eukprot:Plantae.Rhodophyta-Hildenbrandia_rubra.ctg2321.p1 GENE.Plantae.Rhodophyta-Hildenbrandia_rubra.ctg2321~~Plantae.Rhodophyta-Hildenbrandia_rubra.ctg2321.p1  ORF type:complete len:404 (-),score=63.99 Plantae.Rhodophyta-Hildenbrandia_rubra.ctg2321:948-2159(-)
MATMEVCRTKASLRECLAPYRRRGVSVALVPTMGSLHRGHLSLVPLARKHCTIVVLSIFVNREQFAPGEDYENYPRDEAGDLEKCRSIGVDIVYIPSESEVYRRGYGTFVHVDCGDPDWNVAAEGAVRPTFFRGVATVMLKLMNLIRPDVVTLGQKDAQQNAVVSKMIKDLDLEVKVVVGDTVRTMDGVAMSSRNRYLTAEERKKASVLFKGLIEARRIAVNGEKQVRIIKRVIESNISEFMQGYEGFQLLYVSVAKKDSMEEIQGEIPPGVDIVLAVSAMLGKARLLDNVLIKSMPEAPLQKRKRKDERYFDDLNSKQGREKRLNLTHVPEKPDKRKQSWCALCGITEQRKQYGFKATDWCLACNVPLCTKARKEQDGVSCFRKWHTADFLARALIHGEEAS